MSNPLQDSALLVTLNISQWTARKLDKRVSSEVAKAHGATDAGNFNKLLVDKAYLEPMDRIAGAARQYHYKVTLAWGDNGDRLLPAALFMDYSDTMRLFKNEFEDKARTFDGLYPSLVQSARTRLNTMYDPADYPSNIRDRFTFSTSFTQVPTANDFRVNLNKEYVDSIKADMTERERARRKDAMKECYARVRSVVGKMSEQCGKEKGKIFDSMIDNARELASMLPAFNFDNDPELNDLAAEINSILVPPDRLRQDVRLRADTAAKADAILAKLPWA